MCVLCCIVFCPCWWCDVCTVLHCLFAECFLTPCFVSASFDYWTKQRNFFCGGMLEFKFGFPYLVHAHILYGVNTFSFVCYVLVKSSKHYTMSYLQNYLVSEIYRKGTLFCQLANAYLHFKISNSFINKRPCLSVCLHACGNHNSSQNNDRRLKFMSWF
jgi:hypothetical protein